jgi:hypothetical protein
VKDKEEVAPPPAARSWARPEAYFEALARRRTERRKREPRPQSQHLPRPPIGALPFVALMCALGVLAIGIMVTAWPGQPKRHPPPQQREQGIAPKGWFQKAEREFR